MKYLCAARGVLPLLFTYVRTCLSCRRAFSPSESCRGGPIGLLFALGSSLFGLPRMRLSVVSDSLSARFARWASATLTRRRQQEGGGVNAAIDVAV